MLNSEVQEKIKKLLSLATSDNINEAQAALLKAQELMVKYHIENSDLSETKEDVVVVYYNFREANKRRMTYHLYIASIIASNFRVRTYYNSQVINFVGFKSDADAALACYTYILDRVEVCFNKFLNDYKINNPEQFIIGAISLSKQLKNNWTKGFVVGLNAAFEEQRTKNCYDLVLVVPQEVEDEYNKVNLKESSAKLPESKLDSFEAFEDGHRSGMESINNRSLGYTKLEA